MNIWVLGLILLGLLLTRPKPQQPEPPEPPPPGNGGGPNITNITFQPSTHREFAPGSDNWNITWSDDDHQYTVWGDGPGFGSTNNAGLVGLGVARIQGNPGTYTGKNVNGGLNPEGATDWPERRDGKSYGIISIGGILYMWWTPGSRQTIFNSTRLWRSNNKGRNWSPANWQFVRSENLMLPTFLQQGKDFAENKDGFLYSYFIHPRDPSPDLNIQKPGTIYLARARVAGEAFFNSKSAWEWWNGSGWSSNINSKAAVQGLGGSAGVGWCISACYNPGLNKYLFVTEINQSHNGQLRFYQADKIEGPWTQIKSFTNFHNEMGVLDRRIFYASFSPKWFRNGGRDFTLVWTGTHDNDSWNTIDGSFTV